jgi:nitroreductase
LDIHEAILKRHTVRDFQEIPISQEAIKRIIDAGLRAPSNDHLRQWEFILVNDQAVRLNVIEQVNKNLTVRDSEKLLNKWGYTDTYQRQMYIDAIPKQYRMLLQAGCLIIPCFRQKSPLLKPKNLSALNGFASIWCCIENMLLYAVSEGIYGVTRIPFDKEIKHIKRILNIPEDYVIPCYLALGYPEKNSGKEIPQHTIQPENRIHFNKWGNKSSY